MAWTDSRVLRAFLTDTPYTPNTLEPPKGGSFASVNLRVEKD